MTFFTFRSLYLAEEINASNQSINGIRLRRKHVHIVALLRRAAPAILFQPQEKLRRCNDCNSE